MAVAHATLFARLGRLFDHFASVKAFKNTLDTELADTVSNYSGADLDMIGLLLQNSETRKSDANGVAGDLHSAAVKTLIDTVDDNYSIPRRNVYEAAAELIRQMLLDSKTVDGNTITVGSTAAGSSNVGNGTLVFSEIAPVLDRAKNRPGNLVVQTIKSEAVTANCVEDSTARTIAEGGEKFKVFGQRAEDRFHEDWPQGSGATIVIPAASPRVNGGRGPGKNILHNGDFEEFTSNAPDHWTISTGVAGTHIFAAGAGATQSNALKFVGDGSTNPKITQQLRTTTGSLGQLNTDKPYTISFLVKYATARPGQTLRVSVTSDGSTVYNSGVIGRAMQATVLSSALGTSYALVSLKCFTPLALAKNSVVTIDFAGNIDNTSEVFIDDLVIAQMHEMGPGLGSVQVIPGVTSYRAGDEFTAEITNNGEGAIQQEFDRFFNMQNHGLALPGNTAGGENIADTLIS